MSENVKKIGLGVVIAVALVAAIFEGVNLVRGPQLTVLGGMNSFKKGHGMKDGLKALMKAKSGSPGAGTPAPPPSP